MSAVHAPIFLVRALQQELLPAFIDFYVFNSISVYLVTYTEPQALLNMFVFSNWLFKVVY